MSPSNVQHGEATRLLAVQSALVAAVAAGFALLGPAGSLAAALYGGGIELLRSYLLCRRVRMAAEVARRSPGAETTVLYIGAVQRFVVVLALFALGFGWLGLAPVPLLVAFGATQVAFFLTRGVGGRVTTASR